MPFMLKITWDIKVGAEAEFRSNQEKLCEVMRKACHDSAAGAFVLHPRATRDSSV